MKKGYTGAIIVIILMGILGAYILFFVGDTSKYDSQTTAYRIEPNREISSGGDTYRPIYYYSVDGVEYQHISDSSSSSYPKQSKNKVYYDSSNPENCMVEYEKASSTTIGVVCMSISVIMIIMVVLSVRSKNSGETISAETFYENNQERIDETVEKTSKVINKFAKIQKIMLLLFVIFIAVIILLFQIGIVKQTIESADYVPTTATYVRMDINEEASELCKYVYEYEDKNGNSYEATVTSSAEEGTFDRTIEIKYDESNPEKYVTKSMIFEGTDYLYVALDIIVIIVCVMLLFNDRLLSKIRIGGHIG